MTAIQKQADNPIAHLTAEDIEQHRHRARRDPPGGPRQPRRRRRGVHPPGDRRPAQARARQPRGAAASASSRRRGCVGTVGLSRRQDPREHGDRAQHPARPVGLDARPEDPLHDLGVGQRHPGRAVEALAQRAAPHVHERDRQGQRPRLRHHARRRGPALAPDLPGPAAVELHQRLLLRVRHRRLRPRARQEPSRRSRPRTPSSRPAPSRCWRKIRKQATKDYVVHPLLSLPTGSFLPTLAANFTANVGPQPVVALDHHVRPLPRGRRDLREALDRRRDPRRVVRPPDARLGQHLRLQGHAHHDRQPVATRSSTTCSPTCRSNRYAEIAPKVQDLFDQYGLNYHSAPAAAAGLLGLAQGRPAVAAQRLAGRDDADERPGAAGQALQDDDRRPEGPPRPPARRLTDRHPLQAGANPLTRGASGTATGDHAPHRLRALSR